MKGINSDEAEIPIVNIASNVDEIYLHANLVVSNVSQNQLTKIVELFALQIIKSVDSHSHILATSSVRPGEHKLQTISLLAAAIIIRTHITQAMLLLEIRNEFAQYRDQKYLNNFLHKQRL